MAATASANSALTMPLSAHKYRPFTLRSPRLPARWHTALRVPDKSRVTQRCLSVKTSAASQELVSVPACLGSTLLATGAPFGLTAAAFAAAEDVPSANAPTLEQFQNGIAENTGQAADQAVAAASNVPPLVTGLVVFSPLILYVIFVAYRAKLNPRATITDFAFVVAGIIVVLNLLSILIFKIRFF